MHGIVLFIEFGSTATPFTTGVLFIAVVAAIAAAVLIGL